jgi:calcium-dependent protein kinase
MTSKKGTPMYAAPEVLTSVSMSSHASYDERCDVWSVGVMTYILLCGFPPIQGNTDEETMRKVKRGKFDFPSPEWNSVSQDAKTFIRAMMEKDARKRLYAAELLETTHGKWLYKKDARKSIMAMTEDETSNLHFDNLVSNLKKVNNSRRLKKIALTMIATQIQDKEIEELRSQFKALDKDGDGTINRDELQDLLDTMPHLNVQVSDFSNIDSDGSGEIDYTEFIAATLDARTYQTESNMWAAFCVFDKDGDGKITRDEMKERAVGCSNEDIVNMIKEADLNGDGEITFDEFKAMLMKT